MSRFLIKRLLTMIVTLFMIALLTFCLMHIVPGSPFTSVKQVSQGVMDAMNAKYKLDDPLWKQFVDYIAGILRFDFGPSYKYTGKTVNDFIESGMPYSGRLGLITLIFTLVTSIPMGIFAALKNGKWQDMLIMFIATFGVTIPSFVIATGLLYIFSFKLGWTPIYGVDKWTGYILPMIAMGGYSISFMARLMRSSLLEVMGQDYIRTARAKGISEFRVVTKHALRNALLPVVTVLGPTIANLLTGSFVIEKIFAIPGLGSHFVNSVTQRDYTTIMGMTIFYATVLVTMVLLVDIFYCLIDPRIRYD